jgi:DNA-binding winged helix-turn-helix (wHTH) protein
MAAHMPSNTVYAIGPFTLDPASKRLLRDEALVDLPLTQFELLHLLVRRAGKLVLKRELGYRGDWPPVFQ